MLIRSLVLLAALFIAACGSAEESPGATSSAGPVDATGSWLLTEGTANGQPIPLVSDAPITLTIQGASVGGQSGCNQYFGELTLVDGAVRIGGLGGTEMACVDPVMAEEATYMQALAAVRAARRDGDALVLLGPDVELRFARQAAVPTAELVATTWILDSLVQGDAVASTIGEPATLVFHPDGTFEGSSGCRKLSGTYVETDAADDVIDFTVFTLDGECAGGPADQDSHVVQVLRDGFRATIDGQQLTLTADGGLGLIYGAAPAE
jgi:heat shock protein HslJ